MSGFALCDSHCHTWIDPPFGSDSPRLAERKTIRAELDAFAAAGGVLVIDCQPGGCGRDGRVHADLAAATGVAIASATGFHMERHYGADRGPWDDPDGALDLWTSELAEGLAEAPAVRARLVKSAWTGQGGTESGLMLAAATAAARTDAALVVHTERGAAVEGLVELLSGTGLPPDRTQISHIDKRPDAGLHRELARAGYVLGYDTFLRPKYRPEETTWPLLLGLIEDGLWPRVTVGFDLVDPTDWSVGGGAGLPALATRIVPRLQEAGVEDEAIEALVGGNGIRLVDWREAAR